MITYTNGDIANPIIGINTISDSHPFFSLSCNLRIINDAMGTSTPMASRYNTVATVRCRERGLRFKETNSLGANSATIINKHVLNAKNTQNSFLDARPE